MAARGFRKAIDFLEKGYLAMENPANTGLIYDVRAAYSLFIDRNGRTAAFFRIIKKIVGTMEVFFF